VHAKISQRSWMLASVVACTMPGEANKRAIDELMQGYNSLRNTMITVELNRIDSSVI
jgi:hypothetical protein